MTDTTATTATPAPQPAPVKTWKPLPIPACLLPTTTKATPKKPSRLTS